jgi:hypothetical protein
VFEIEGQPTLAVRYADGLVILAEEEAMLQGKKYRIIESGRCCGMVMNVENTKAMRISRLQSTT